MSFINLEILSIEDLNRMKILILQKSFDYLFTDEFKFRVCAEMIEKVDNELKRRSK